MLVDFPGMGTQRSLATDARDAVLFGVCYLALDWASFSYPLGPFNITPWNPPSGLSIVWMLLGGLRYAPVVFTAILLGDVLIRHAPGGMHLSVLTSLVLAAGYTGIVAMLKLRFNFNGRLRETRQLWNFVLVTAGGGAVIGLVYVSILWLSGFLVVGSFTDAVFRFWLGDTVGVLVTAPLLMVAASPEGRRLLTHSLRKPETALQFIALTGLIFFMFEKGSAPHQYFYLLFLPLIWIASRNGLSGAVAASGVVQVGVVMGSQIGALQVVAVVELQALVTALTLTGLALGIIVDERERAVEDLKRTLRLAAASEMAGAIAHEINQPLAAMHNYGNACQIMLRQGPNGLVFAQLQSAVDKMLQESKRAAEVVRRLRDLFRRGSIRLEPVKIAILLERAATIGKELSEASDITFKVDSSDGDRTLLGDPVQIGLVLRNLIANAVEAVAEIPSGEKGVTVSTHVLHGGRIMFRVSDTGKGLSPQARERLFEPISTSKVAGMGIGLSICRTIAEAHGGTLYMADTAHGEFNLVLPIGSGNE